MRPSNHISLIALCMVIALSLTSILTTAQTTSPITLATPSLTFKIDDTPETVKYIELKASAEKVNRAFAVKYIGPIWNLGTDVFSYKKSEVTLSSPLQTSSGWIFLPKDSATGVRPSLNLPMKLPVTRSQLGFSGGTGIIRLAIYTCPGDTGDCKTSVKTTIVDIPVVLVPEPDKESAACVGTTRTWLGLGETKNCCGDDANEYTIAGTDGSKTCCDTPPPFTIVQLGSCIKLPGAPIGPVMENPPSDVVALWAFNGSGTTDTGAPIALRDSAGNHPLSLGTISGRTLVTTASALTMVQGEIDGALSVEAYPAPTVYLTTSDAPDLRPSGDFTIHTWVKRQHQASNLISKSIPGQPPTNPSYALEIAPVYPGGPHFEARFSVTANPATPTLTTIGSFLQYPAAYQPFMLITGVYSKSQQKISIYVDGVKKAEKAVTGDIVYGPGPIEIASRVGEFYGGIDMRGQIDEIKLFSRALSDAEIADTFKTNCHDGTRSLGEEGIDCGGSRCVMCPLTMTLEFQAGQKLHFTTPFAPRQISGELMTASGGTITQYGSTLTSNQILSRGQTYTLNPTKAGTITLDGFPDPVQTRSIYMGDGVTAYRPAFVSVDRKSSTILTIGQLEAAVRATNTFSTVCVADPRTTGGPVECGGFQRYPSTMPLHPRLPLVIVPQKAHDFKLTGTPWTQAEINAPLPANKVTLAQGASITIQKGAILKLTPTLTRMDGTTETSPWHFTYASSNPTILTVSADGSATGPNTGTATVTVSSEGASATIQVTVQ